MGPKTRKKQKKTYRCPKPIGSNSTRSYPWNPGSHFRSNLSVWDAVETLKNKTQRCNIIIEGGDIISAYNNVEHHIFMNLLRERIRDKKFLNLIKAMLKSGIIDGSIFEHSLKGTPQDSIVSPYYLIYMLGFDRFVYEEVILPIIQNNKTKLTNTTSKECSKIPSVEITKMKKGAVYVRYADE